MIVVGRRLRAIVSFFRVEGEGEEEETKMV